MFKNSMLALILAFSSVLPAAAATIDLTPAAPTGTIGQSFSVDVAISNITDLYSFQFDIGFNPAVLTVTGISEGNFLSAGGSTLFIDGAIDNSAGNIANTADALNGAVAGVTGSGVFAKIDFKIVGSGSSAINLFNGIFLDSSLTDISVTPINNASITVNSVSAVPLPGALSLFAIGSALVGLLGRQRRVTKQLG